MVARLFPSCRFPLRVLPLCCHVAAYVRPTHRRSDLFRQVVIRMDLVRPSERHFGEARFRVGLLLRSLHSVSLATHGRALRRRVFRCCLCRAYRSEQRRLDHDVHFGQRRRPQRTDPRARSPWSPSHPRGRHVAARGECRFRRSPPGCRTCAVTSDPTNAQNPSSPAARTMAWIVLVLSTVPDLRHSPRCTGKYRSVVSVPPRRSSSLA